MLNKLHDVADYEGRLANSQVLILICDAIEKYEEITGKLRNKNAPQFWVLFQNCGEFYVFYYLFIE